MNWWHKKLLSGYKNPRQNKRKMSNDCWKFFFFFHTCDRLLLPKRICGYRSSWHSETWGHSMHCQEEEEANGPKTRKRLKTVASRHRYLFLDFYDPCTHLAPGHKTPQMMTHPHKETFFCLDNILDFVFVLYAFVILTPRSARQWNPCRITAAATFCPLAKKWRSQFCVWEWSLCRALNSPVKKRKGPFSLNGPRHLWRQGEKNAVLFLPNWIRTALAPWYYESRREKTQCEAL